MTVSLKDFKDVLDFLSNKYDIDKEWIIRNGVWLLYMCCDGLKHHTIDAEYLLLSEEKVFKRFIDEEYFK